MLPFPRSHSKALCICDYAPSSSGVAVRSSDRTSFQALPRKADGDRRCNQQAETCAICVMKPQMLVLCAQFLAPFIMVKKGGKLPEGNINNWFFERGDLKSSLPGRMPTGMVC